MEQLFIAIKVIVIMTIIGAAAGFIKRTVTRARALSAERTAEQLGQTVATMERKADKLRKAFQSGRSVPP